MTQEGSEGQDLQATPPRKQPKRIQLNLSHQRWCYQLETLARTRNISSTQLIYDTIHRAFGIKPPLTSEIGRPKTPPSAELVEEARKLLEAGHTLSQTAFTLNVSTYLLKNALERQT